MRRGWPSLHWGLGGACALLMLGTSSASADPLGYAPALRGPQIMLYFQLPFGRGNQAVSLYGLRLEQTRLVGGSAPTTLIAVPYHQQLLDLQFRPHADMQIEFGRRVTWDFGRQSFAPTRPSTLLIRWPLDGRRAAEALPQAMIGGWPQAPRPTLLP